MENGNNIFNKNNGFWKGLQIVIEVILVSSIKNDGSKEDGNFCKGWVILVFVIINKVFNCWCNNLVGGCVCQVC